jgi:hypothetical protein
MQPNITTKVYILVIQCPNFNKQGLE